MMHTLSNTCMHWHISRACTETSGQLMYSLKFWLWINYPIHILTEPGKCTVSHLVFELFKISGVSNFLFSKLTKAQKYFTRFSA